MAANMDREALKNITELRTESYSDWIGIMSSDESMMILELVVDDVELLPGVVAVSLSSDPSDPFKSNESNTKETEKENRKIHEKATSAPSLRESQYYHVHSRHKMGGKNCKRKI
jgi:chromatin remodeling complex protein RSC6